MFFSFPHNTIGYWLEEIDLSYTKTYSSVNEEGVICYFSLLSDLILWHWSISIHSSNKYFLRSSYDGSTGADDITENMTMYLGRALINRKRYNANIRVQYEIDIMEIYSKNVDAERKCCQLWKAVWGNEERLRLEVTVELNLKDKQKCRCEQQESWRF